MLTSLLARPLPAAAFRRACAVRRGADKSPAGRAAYAASSDPPKYTLLTYDYVPDILEKRGPYRADHLAAAFRKQEEGKLLAGGPFTDPVDGAVFVFKDVPVAEVEEFVKTDPYVVNGLVPKWNIRQYLAVIN